MIDRRTLLAALAIAPAAAGAAGKGSGDHRRLAPTPPMGWNSWDSFGPTITEAQAIANADVMARVLLPHGYDVFTVDIQWYEPGADSFDYRKGAPLVMDAWGRLLPAPNRFPSAAAGRGFRPLADRIHALGLKFGIHLMRGIPRLAVERDLPVLGTKVRAADIADRGSICPWNTDMYGVDMRKPGAQAYYDGVFRQIAGWGVDFVKVDDLSRPYAEHRPEIEAIRRAIDRSGRPMVLSMSPGETPVAEWAHARAHANMWRISDDFWDSWPAVREQFTRLRNWNPYRAAGGWPDADMLPFGLLALGKRHSNFTPDEARTVMTLWSIARSPLIMGGDLRALDGDTLALLTNDAVLAVNQHSSGNRPLFEQGGLIGWCADVPGTRDRYLALFNTRDRAGVQPGVPVAGALAALGLAGAARARDLWSGADLGPVAHDWAPIVPWHGAGLYRLDTD
uniref:glycoside hydrolase family 27 protein n=1 Tax=uncultured Sphingomonas sp. TaxID=158754 RepID=UPI0035CB75AB